MAKSFTNCVTCLLLLSYAQGSDSQGENWGFEDGQGKSGNFFFFGLEKTRFLRKKSRKKWIWNCILFLTINHNC